MVKATRRPRDVTTGHVRVSRERKDYKDGNAACLSISAVSSFDGTKWRLVPVDGTKAHVGNGGKVPLILTLILQ